MSALPRAPRTRMLSAVVSLVTPAGYPLPPPGAERQQHDLAIRVRAVRLDYNNTSLPPRRVQ